MKNERDADVRSAENTEMAPEYDFEKMSLAQGRTREKLLERAANRRLTPELAKQFPNDESVNAALAEYIELKRKSA
jgi:hypothetical protein